MFYINFCFKWHYHESSLRDSLGTHLELFKAKEGLVEPVEYPAQHE